MNYWWVNHKKTYKREIEGGYIWSPKANNNGARNQTYINLTLTKPGDLVFSYADSLIKAIGVVRADHREQPKPQDFGVAGDVWSDVGWAVPIDWEILDQPIRPKDYLHLIYPLLPEAHSPIQANGNGNQGCYLAAISNELGDLLVSLANELNHSVIEALESDHIEQQEEAASETIRASVLDETEKDQLIKARRGQGLFRKNVEKIEKSCRVTGVAFKSLLVASHIKPWRLCDNAARLDGNNGLLLSPHIDKLFDQGWVTFADNGDLKASCPKVEATLSQWGVSLPCNVGTFNAVQAEFMKFHRENVFKG